MSILELKNISSGYRRKQVLFDICLKVKRGEVILLVGANGSGKSTLLRTIFGLVDSMSFSGERGQICFDGEDITQSKPYQLLYKGLLYLPQKNSCFDNLTVKDNFEVSGIALKDHKLFKERYDEVMHFFPMLAEFVNVKPFMMSGGERQILSLAMALIHRPRMVLMDEPFTGLSPLSIEKVKSIIQQLNLQQGITFLIAEHIILEALTLTRRLIALKLGKIVKDTDVADDFDLDSLIQVIL